MLIEMNPELKVTKNIEINADISRVWNALVNPEIIKEYLFGTETVTDWKVGSPIVFQGEYDDKSYQDKGTILQNIPGNLIKYSYWSDMSGLEDKPENYATITYMLKMVGTKTVLFLEQKGFVNIESQQHSYKMWDVVLGQLKEIVEE